MTFIQDQPDGNSSSSTAPKVVHVDDMEIDLTLCTLQRGKNEILARDADLQDGSTERQRHSQGQVHKLYFQGLWDQSF